MHDERFKRNVKGSKKLMKTVKVFRGGYHGSRSRKSIVTKAKCRPDDLLSLPMHQPLSVIIVKSRPMILDDGYLEI